MLAGPGRTTQMNRYALWGVATLRASTLRVSLQIAVQFVEGSSHRMGTTAKQKPPPVAGVLCLVGLPR